MKRNRNINLIVLRNVSLLFFYMVSVFSFTSCKVNKVIETKCYNQQITKTDSLITEICNIREMYDPLTRKKVLVVPKGNDSSFVKRSVTYNAFTKEKTVEILYRNKVQIRYVTKEGKVHGQYTEFLLPKCEQITREATFKKGKLDGYYNVYYVGGKRIIHKLYKNDTLVNDESE